MNDGSGAHWPALNTAAASVDQPARIAGSPAVATGPCLGDTPCAAPCVQRGRHCRGLLQRVVHFSEPALEVTRDKVGRGVSGDEFGMPDNLTVKVDGRGDTVDVKLFERCIGESGQRGLRCQPPGVLQDR